MEAALLHDILLLRLHLLVSSMLQSASIEPGSIQHNNRAKFTVSNPKVLHPSFLYIGR
jgi:hypothetical protein